MSGQVPFFLDKNVPALTPEEQFAYNMQQALGMNLAPKAQKQLLPPELAKSVPVDLGVPLSGSSSHNSEMQQLIGRSDEIAKMYRTKIKEDINKQEGSIDQLNQSVNALRGKDLSPDLSPLFALSDSWYGGNISKGYQAPMSEEERQKQVAGLQEKISKERYGLSQTEIEAMKADLSNQKSMLDTKQGRFNDSQLMKKETELQKDVNKSVLDPFNDADKNFSILDAALKDGSVSRVEQVTSQFARSVAAEKGPLSDSDVARVILPTLSGTVQKLLAKLDPNTKAPPEVINQIQAAVNEAKLQTRRVGQLKLKQLQDQYASRASYAGDVMAPTGFGPKLFEKANERFKIDSAPAPEGGGSTEDKAKRLQELKAKYGR